MTQWCSRRWARRAGGCFPPTRSNICLIGLATALFAVAAGSLSALVVVTQVMTLGFVWLPGPALAAAAGAVAATVILGLIGTFSALGQKPAPVLRTL